MPVHFLKNNRENTGWVGLGRFVPLPVKLYEFEI